MANLVILAALILDPSSGVCAKIPLLRGISRFFMSGTFPEKP
ncbi:hypothetical protein [Bradyrhizobium elkanii]|nr:hypothetical protein [Bradyrhizobium elkanii]